MPPSNVLPIHGNEKTMNLNSLILTNIQSSPYFKVHLYELKTYHQVIDEIYHKVNHLEPWEKGSRKTAGQTGMCGGVRGVGAGGIVSSAYCLLYKLYTLKLTRKQLIGLCTHTDSPYIRALGLMYIRYTQPPSDLLEWYEPYLDDEEEVDVKAGGGNVMTIGEIAQQFLTKLEWYSTLFPRLPVPIQKQIEENMTARRARNWNKNASRHADGGEPMQRETRSDGELSFGEAERIARLEAAGRERRPASPPRRAGAYDPGNKERSQTRDRERSRTRLDQDRHTQSSNDHQKRSRSHGRHSKSHDHHLLHSEDHHYRSADNHKSSDRSQHKSYKSSDRSQRGSCDRSHRNNRSKDSKKSSSHSRKRSHSHDDRNVKRFDNSSKH